MELMVNKSVCLNLPFSIGYNVQECVLSIKGKIFWQNLLINYILFDQQESSDAKTDYFVQYLYTKHYPIQTSL